MADLKPARALAERIRIDCCWLDHTREGGPGIDFDAEAAAELLEQYAAEVREQERQACIEYAERTERMFLARAQAIADNSDRADAEAASDDEERHEMRAEGARAVAHGLRHAAHRAGVAAAGGWHKGPSEDSGRTIATPQQPSRVEPEKEERRGHDCEDEDFAEALWKHRAALLRDARALRRVEALPDKWREEARHYPDTPEGDHAAAAVRLCAREIEKALATTTTEPADDARAELAATKAKLAELEAENADLPPAPAKPVCSTCCDTHRMTLGEDEREVMCTRCPVPCERCRSKPQGPYCAATPCPCECHSKREPAPAQEAPRPSGEDEHGLSWKVPLWDAINAYVATCGGDASKHVYGNTRRMQIVVEVERIVESRCNTPEPAASVPRSEVEALLDEARDERDSQESGGTDG